MRVFVAVAAAVFLLHTVAAFPVFTVQGTYYGAGQQLGSQAAALLRIRLQRPGINASIRPFLATSTGRNLSDNLLRTSTRLFPHLVEELQGVADGSGIAFNDVWMLNTLDELGTYISTYNVSSNGVRGEANTGGSSLLVEHCTDILTNSALSPAWGHNEDGDVHDRLSNYFVNATIFEADAEGHPTAVVAERFVSFTYAGSLAGDAYGWNHHGIALSQNAVFATQLNYFGCPGQVSARAAYGARTLDDAVRIIRYSTSANSYNLNVASTSTTVLGDILSVEVDPMGILGVHSLRRQVPPSQEPQGMLRSPYWFYHTNMYITLATACANDPSSDHRMATLATYAVPNATRDIAQMLGDTSDPMYPIYRDGRAPDTDVVTLTTVVYDLQQKMAMVYASNPRLGKPLLTLPLW